MKNIFPISVIIPTVGRLQISNCLTSLLHQSILPDEIVVVDNSSNQIAKKITNQFTNLLPIKYIQELRRGVAYARNTGIKVATNDLIAFIDDDCIAKKNWIKNIISFSSLHRNCILQGKCINGFPTNIISCIEQFSTESFFSQGRYRHKNIIYSNFLDTKNFSLRKSIFSKYFNFDTRFTNIFEDVEFSQRIHIGGLKIIYEPKILILHFGRTEFFPHCKREFNKGKDNYRFINKWKYSNVGNKKKQRIIRDIESLKRKSIENRLKRKILSNKDIFFRLTFHLFIMLDNILLRLGFYWAKLLK